MFKPIALAICKRLPPVFLRHAGGMNLAATNLESLAIEQKIIRSDGENVQRHPRFFVCP